VICGTFSSIQIQIRGNERNQAQNQLPVSTDNRQRQTIYVHPLYPHRQRYSKAIKKAKAETCVAKKEKKKRKKREFPPSVKPTKPSYQAVISSTSPTVPAFTAPISLFPILPAGQSGSRAITLGITSLKKPVIWVLTSSNCNKKASWPSGESMVANLALGITSASSCCSAKVNNPSLSMPIISAGCCIICNAA